MYETPSGFSLLLSNGHSLIIDFFFFNERNCITLRVKSQWFAKLISWLIFFFFFFLGPHLGHMEVPRLEVKSELQPLASATAMLDLSSICDLHCRSRQHEILNPLSGARDWTRILMDTSRVRYHWVPTGTPSWLILRADFPVSNSRRTYRIAVGEAHKTTLCCLNVYITVKVKRTMSH